MFVELLHRYSFNSDEANWYPDYVPDIIDTTGTWDTAGIFTTFLYESAILKNDTAHFYWSEAGNYSVLPFWGIPLDAQDPSIFFDDNMIITFEIWMTFNMTSLGQNPTIISIAKRSSVPTSREVFGEDQDLFFVIEKNVFTVKADANRLRQIDTEKLVVVAYNSLTGDLSLSIDSVPIYNGTVSSEAIFDLNFGDELYFFVGKGAKLNYDETTVPGYNGQISEFRVWRGKLSDEEVSEDMQLGADVLGKTCCIITVHYRLAISYVYSVYFQRGILVRMVNPWKLD